jgi:hypothetical protein
MALDWLASTYRNNDVPAYRATLKRALTVSQALYNPNDAKSVNQINRFSSLLTKSQGKPSGSLAASGPTAASVPTGSTSHSDAWIGWAVGLAIASVFLFRIGIIPLAGIGVSIAAVIKSKGNGWATAALIANVFYMVMNALAYGHL